MSPTSPAHLAPSPFPRKPTKQRSQLYLNVPFTTQGTKGLTPDTTNHSTNKEQSYDTGNKRQGGWGEGSVYRLSPRDNEPPRLIVRDRCPLTVVTPKPHGIPHASFRISCPERENLGSRFAREGGWQRRWQPAVSVLNRLYRRRNASERILVKPTTQANCRPINQR